MAYRRQYWFDGFFDGGDSKESKSLKRPRSPVEEEGQWERRVKPRSKGEHKEQEAKHLFEMEMEREGRPPFYEVVSEREVQRAAKAIAQGDTKTFDEIYGALSEWLESKQIPQEM